LSLNILTNHFRILDKRFFSDRKLSLSEFDSNIFSTSRMPLNEDFKLETGKLKITIPVESNFITFVPGPGLEHEKTGYSFFEVYLSKRIQAINFAENRVNLWRIRSIKT
jgi:hypothetical protein